MNNSPPNPPSPPAKSCGNPIMKGYPSFPMQPFWLACVLIVLTLGGSVQVAEADVPPPAKREFREPESDEQQQRIVTVAIYLLIAVTVTIVSLLIIVMLWGARVRRQARQPLPSTSPNDPLWYLKGKNPKPTEPNKPPGVSDSKTTKQDAAEASSPSDDSDDAEEPPSV